ncbi:MAG TPA: 2-phospho-L-lactate transferase [Candidatus Dormibacteraeota bacterium]|nr:2-phospho-L-lactate transferase [Candidatus Dormibacteraeota bacterium]
MSAQRVVVLAGGVGAARFLQGLTAGFPAVDLTIIGNVGDDTDIAGLHISPDLDTVLYTLTGEIDGERGWGVRGDSARALQRARSLGADAWFWLGDLDLGLHMARTEWLSVGEPLSVVTARLCTALGLAGRLLPCTDDRVRTMIETSDGELDFQTYYVRRGHADEVVAIRFDGAETATPAPGVLDAIHGADAIIFAPSNPLISIGPILAIPGIRDALASRSVRSVAVSPIVGGAALRGPAAAMLRALGHQVSPVGVAALYSGIIDVMVIDDADAAARSQVEQLGVRAVVTDTIMRDAPARRHLATVALEAAGIGAVP